MSSLERSDRSQRGLLVLIVLALLFLGVAMIVGGRHQSVQCAPLPTLSAVEVPVETHEQELAEAPPERPRAEGAPRSESPVTAPSSGRPVRGFVRDAAIGDQVPFVTVQVRVDKESESVQTDLNGTFVSTRDFPSGKLEIEVFDGTSYGVTKIDRTPAVMDQSTSITIDIGPTFLVHDIGQRRVQQNDAWFLRLVQTPRPLWSAGEIEVRDQELKIALGPDIVWSEVPLRFAGDAAFARWPKVEFQRMPDFRPRVEVRSPARYERGAVEVGDPVGLQELPGVETRRFLVLTGAVQKPRESRSDVARVLVRPDTDSPPKSGRPPPDFREVVVVRDVFELEVAADQRSSVVGWSTFGEPTVLERRIEERGLHRVRDDHVNLLAYPSFDPAGLPPEFEHNVTRGLQIVRARVSGTGPYAMPTVDLWQAFGGRRFGEMIETRYDIESIGVDCTPVTFGRPWKQILPGELVPDRLPTSVVPRTHRIEWLDPRFEEPRTDAHVTGGPGGVILTMQETTLSNTWTVVDKSALRFTVWKPGCEPVALRTEDFNERGHERVASVNLQTGWGVALSFVVIDSEVDLSSTPKSKATARRSGPKKTFAAQFDFLGYPPLPGIGVTSIQVHGESDAEGCVLLHGSTWPDRLSLRAPGYRLRELRRLPGPGARWIAYMEHDRYDP